MGNVPDLVTTLADQYKPTTITENLFGKPIMTFAVTCEA